MHVESWEHYYGFGPGDPRFDTTPYRHTETLTWSGRIVLPEGFKYPRAVVTLSAQQGLLSLDAEPKPIGSNYARNGVLNAHVITFSTKALVAATIRAFSAEVNHLVL